jgi:hypothetical protein
MLLATLLQFPAAEDSGEGEPETVDERAYAEAMALLSSDGVDAAVERLPEAAGYLEALADARRLTNAESRHTGEDCYEGDELTIVESPTQGLWLMRQEDEGAVVLQPIAAATARELVAELARGD